MSDLLEVIVVGLVAGVGLSIAFALALRALILGGDARREGQRGTFIAHSAVATVGLVICIAAVGFALYSMVNH